jgi:hypothetical protein
VCKGKEKKTRGVFSKLEVVGMFNLECFWEISGKQAGEMVSNFDCISRDL